MSRFAIRLVPKKSIMTTNPQQPNPDLNPDPADAELDRELDRALSAALAPPAEQDVEALSAKIVALTDPQMMSLLDQALAADVESDVQADADQHAQRCQRILAVTQPYLATHAAAYDRSIVGRIGLIASPRRIAAYAAAAAIALVAGLVIWQLNQTSTAPDRLAVLDGSSSFADADNLDAIDLDQALAQPDYFADATARLESQIQSVANDITDSDLDANAIDRDTIWADMDSYQQFLVEVEAADLAT